MKHLESKQEKLDKLRKLLSELDKDNQSKEKLWQLIEQWRKKTQTTIAEVQSIFPLEKNELSQIEKRLNFIMQQSILVRNVINPNLIGGIKIIVGSKVIDNSLAGQLLQIENNLKKIN